MPTDNLIFSGMSTHLFPLFSISILFFLIYILLILCGRPDRTFVKIIFTSFTHKKKEVYDSDLTNFVCHKCSFCHCQTCPLQPITVSSNRLVLSRACNGHENSSDMLILTIKSCKLCYLHASYWFL